MIVDSKIIAHRGVHDNKTIPENSLLAFKKSVQMDLPIELDVQLTKDNVLVVFHDSNLVRMCKTNKYIQDSYYSEIRDIKLLDTDEYIPTFQDVLKLVNDKVLIDIEIKNTHRINDTCLELIKLLDGYQNFIIKSFNPMIVKFLKKNYPKLTIGYLITDHYNNIFYDIALTSTGIINYCKPDFIAISKDLVRKKKFLKLSKKIPFLIWTIENKDEIDFSGEFIYICNNLPYL